MISKHSPDPPRIALEDIPGEVFDQLPPLYPIPPGEAHAADEAIYRQVRRQYRKRQPYIIRKPPGLLRRLFRWLVGRPSFWRAYDRRSD